MLGQKNAEGKPLTFFDAWRAGEKSAAVTSYSYPPEIPILVDYDIVSEAGDSVGGSYRFVVQLTFSSRIGGRPVEQHTYTVRKSSLSDSWEVKYPYSSSN